MVAGIKNYRLRGGVDHNDFPARDISLKDVRDVGRIAWEKWGHLIANMPLRDLIGLAYAEGLYHGAMIGIRDQAVLGTVGLNQSGALSVAEPASSSKMIEIEMPTVRDLLE